MYKVLDTLAPASDHSLTGAPRQAGQPAVSQQTAFYLSVMRYVKK